MKDLLYLGEINHWKIVQDHFFSKKKIIIIIILEVGPIFKLKELTPSTSGYYGIKTHISAAKDPAIQKTYQAEKLDRNKITHVILMIGR